MGRAHHFLSLAGDAEKARYLRAVVALQLGLPEDAEAALTARGPVPNGAAGLYGLGQVSRGESGSALRRRVRPSRHTEQQQRDRTVRTRLQLMYQETYGVYSLAVGMPAKQKLWHHSDNMTFSIPMGGQLWHHS